MNRSLVNFLKNTENMDTLLDHMNDGLMLTNEKKEILAINPAFERMTGYTLAEVKGKNPRFLRSGLTPSETYQEMWSALDEKGTWTGELCNERKSGEYFWSYITITVVEQEDTHYIGIMRDISDRKKQENEMKYLAYHDTLTGLPNRAFFKKELEAALDAAKEDGEKVALLFLDLDRFKKVNDSYGHQTGDELLVQFAKRLRQVVGEKGTIGRFGGDEFTIYLPHIQKVVTVLDLLDEIFTSLEKPFNIEGNKVYTTVSIGWSLFPDHGTDFDTLLKNSDNAMYCIKEEGRNDAQMFEDDMVKSLAEYYSLENELIDALYSGELEVYYQLQVDVDARVPFGIEALVRWNHPTKSILSPAIFLPLAEELGIMAELDEWVLHEACKQTSKWHREGYDHLIVSVNVSKRFFEKENFIERVKNAIKNSGLEPRHLCLEITESTAILKNEEIREKLAHLKELGVNISLDDFGTGYSSLSQLSLFPIDTLKIDQSFVRGESTKVNRAIVKLIIEMAQSLGVSVICEGIETEEQLQLIQEEGCNHAQGYLFSRPVPPHECEKLMSKLLS